MVPGYHGRELLKPFPRDMKKAGLRGGQQGEACGRNWARWVSPAGCHPVGVTRGIKQLTGPGSFREKKPSPTWGLAATEGVCARLWECLVRGQALLCNWSQTKHGFNPGWRGWDGARSRDVSMSTPPPFFLSGGCLQSQLPSMVQGGISVSAQACEVQPRGKEKATDKAGGWRTGMVLPVSLSHADGARGPA